MTGQQVRVSYPVDALVSFHYYRDDKHMTPLVASGRLRLIGDSGAFSAHTQGVPIKLDEYAAWCHRWRDHLCWMAALDVIGDPVATFRNWQTLRDKHGLLTVPTLHAGTDTRWLDVYAAEGVDLVGLGGMAGRGQAPRAYRWAVHMFRYARDRWPQVRFHLWGVTSRNFLDALPAYSADSSGVLGQAYRYALLRLFDPTTGKHRNVALQGRRKVFQLAPLLRRVYGIDPSTIETSHSGNRAILIQLAVASTQQYAAWLQKRHNVTPPTIAGGVPAVGTRIHTAGGTPAAKVDDLQIAAGALADPTSAADSTSATGTTDRVPKGTRLHVVDGSPGNLLAVTTQED